MNSRSTQSLVAVCVSFVLGTSAAHSSTAGLADKGLSQPDRSNAIIGGDRAKAQPAAIIGGDVNAIIGGDRAKAQPAAIIGGDVNAIIGGDRAKAQPTAIIGGDGGDFVRNAVASGMIAKGPVEAVDAPSGYIQVLGQRYKAAANAAKIREVSAQVASGIVVTASVYGRHDRGGVQANSIVFSMEEYVPGVTTVFVLGRVDHTDGSRAEIRIRGLAIDYSALLAAGDVTIGTGGMVAIAGSIASPNAALVPSSITRFD